MSGIREKMWLYGRLALLAAAVFLAGLLGLLVGEWTAPRRELPRADAPKRAPQEPGGEQDADNGAPAPRPPVHLFIKALEGEDWEAAEAEMRLAAQAGVHRFVVPAALPWDEDSEAAAAAVDRLRSIAALDPQAQVMLYLVLDPPETWLTEHPDDAALCGGKPTGFASLASESWRADACSAMRRLLEGIAASDMAPRVTGCVLGALQDGLWRPLEGVDSSPANADGFRKWLALEYGGDAALQEAWATESAACETAEIPAMPDRSASGQVFFARPEEQAQIDFLAYTAAVTAGAIEAAATCVHEAGGAIEAVVPYGASFDAAPGGASQCALGRLLDGPVDAFASVLTQHDRGLGGAGGAMTPAASAAVRGKRWCLIDDTRTGIAHDPATGKVKRLEGLRIENVYRVQQRNFAEALAAGMGVFWTDPRGTGWLDDEGMWERFGRMAEAYRALEEELPPEAPLARPDAWPPASNWICVAVDERSRFYQRCGPPLDDLLLTGVYGAVRRCGAPARFCLLEDVLEERMPPASVYIFPNAFRLDEGERDRLHALLEREEAAAIWLYAPGYMAAETAGAEHLNATVRMKVKAFDGPAKSGSAYALAGQWLAENSPVGESAEWTPLFYIEDEEADVIAAYRDSGKPSAAVVFLEQGWASLFLAEPCLTPELLRELLGLLEMPEYIRANASKSLDAAFFGPNLLGLHAQGPGERVIVLGAEGLWDVRDLLDTGVGWQRKREFMAPLDAGGTRLLKLTPLDDAS